MAQPIAIHVGNKMFSFESHAQWVNKARSWFSHSAVRSEDYICISQRGRICTLGMDFSAAADALEFPVDVYLIRDIDGSSLKIAPNGHKAGERMAASIAKNPKIISEMAERIMRETIGPGGDVSSSEGSSPSAGSDVVIVGCGVAALSQSRRPSNGPDLDAPVPELNSENRLVCHSCGKPVSTPVPTDTMVRAWVECPECIQARS